MAMIEALARIEFQDPITQLELECYSWTMDSPVMQDVDDWMHGVIIADERGVLTFANHRAMELHGAVMLGAKPQDYSVLHGLFTEEGRPYPPEDLPLALAVKTRRKIRHSKWLIRRPDATRVLVIGDALPLTNPRGQHVGGILVFRQIV
jgi:PAS domain-containing protein